MCLYIFAATSPKSIGLERCSFIPLALLAATSSEKELADTAIIGMVAASTYPFRRAANASPTLLKVVSCFSCGKSGFKPFIIISSEVEPAVHG